MILYKMFTISYVYAFELLILRLQTRLNFLHKSLTIIIRTTTLVNFCLIIPKKMNLFILQGDFDIAKSVNIILQAF